MEPRPRSPSSPNKPSEYNDDDAPTPTEDAPLSDKPSEYDDDDAPTPTEDAPPSDKPSEHNDNDDDDVPTPSEDMPSSNKPSDDTAPKLDKQCSISSSSSSEASEVENLFQLDAAELSNPLAAESDSADFSTTAHGAEADKPTEWVAWPEPEQQALASDAFLLDSSAVFVAPTQPPEAQMMAKPEAAEGFDPERIPSAIFQAKSTGSAEWSVASNESLFSIHGANQSGDLTAFYTSGRSPFDYFYDEALAAGSLEPEWKLPTVAEAPEAGDVLRPSDDDGHGAKDFTLPGSASSDSSGSASEKIVAFRHDSSSGSSSNFSFAFPILAETSPKNNTSNALYQPLQKESEEPPRMVMFQEEMTEEGPSTEKGWCLCGDCCCCMWKGCCLCRDCCCWPEKGWCLCRDCCRGEDCCCWFPCSWRWRCCFPWWCCCDCDCHCHFPSCGCRCCLCF